MLCWQSAQHRQVEAVFACIRCGTVSAEGRYDTVEEAHAHARRPPSCQTCHSDLVALKVGTCVNCGVLRIIHPSSNRCTRCLDDLPPGPLPRCPLEPDDAPIVHWRELLQAQIYLRQDVEAEEFPASIPLGDGHTSEELWSRSDGVKLTDKWEDDDYSNTGGQCSQAILLIVQLVFAAFAAGASLTFHSWSMLFVLWAFAFAVFLFGVRVGKDGYNHYLSYHEAIQGQSSETASDRKSVNRFLRYRRPIEAQVARVYYCGRHDATFVLGGNKALPPERCGELIETDPERLGKRNRIGGAIPASWLQWSPLDWLSAVTLAFIVIVEAGTPVVLVVYWIYHLISGH